MGKRNLSITLVSPYPFTQEPGGVKDFILGLKEALIKHKCIVNVIAPGSSSLAEKGVVDFVLGVSFKVATDQTEFGASFSRKETAEKILKAVKPDIIVIHEPFVPSIGHTIISSIAKDQKRPIIVGQFHANREDFNWWLNAVEFIVRHFIRRPILDEKTVLGLSSGYVATINDNLNGRIAVSKATKKFWQKKLPAGYEVIFNGIDTKKLTPDGPKISSWRNPTSSRSAELRGAERIILFAGRHDHRKGIEDLINAFNILIKDGQKDIKLKITGSGEITKFLQEMVKKLGLTRLIEFIGILPHTRLAKAYRTADLIVAPSTGGEGFNRTIIEARACGTLVVCTDIGGQDEAIGKDLAHFMAKPKNPRDLANQITKILNLSDAKKLEIKKRSREDVVANFDWEVIVKKHLEYYKKLLN
jgi:glycosyltransferase involved in cell wall biosynthesis